jgi:predicted nucleic acid-binding protein
VILSADEPKRFFVDTNVIGYIASLIEPLAHDYRDLIRSDALAGRVPSMATVVAAELERGAAELESSGGVRHLAIAERLRTLMAVFEEVHADEQTDDIASHLQAAARRVGHPIGADSQQVDLEIAALAIRHRAPLVTHNYSDFDNIDALDLRTLATGRKRPPRVTERLG